MSSDDTGDAPQVAAPTPVPVAEPAAEPDSVAVADVDAEPSDGADPPAPGAMGATAARGLLWMVLSGGGIRLMSVVTQILLGYLLVKDDFGVYAIAVSLAFMARVLRDGGVRLLIVQEGRERFHENARDGFAVAGGFSVVAAVGLALFAPFAERIYDQPSLSAVLLVLALSLVFEPFVLIGQANLQLQFRFGELARVLMVWTAMTYAGSVALALVGVGALSFVWPIAVGNLWMAWYLGRRVDDPPWRQRPDWRSSWGLLVRSRWVMLGSFVTRGPQQLDYLALGLVAPTAVVGIYYFAYSLTFQVATLVIANFYRVLMPVFAELRHDLERLQGAVQRSAGGLSLACTPLLLVLCTTIEPIEEVVWRGRWAVAVPAIMVFSLLLPVYLMAFIPEIVLQARGDFRLWTGVNVVRAVGVPIAAYVAGVVTEDWSDTAAQVAAITAIVAGWLVVSGLWTGAVSLRVSHLRVAPVARSAAGPYVAGLGATAVAWAVDLVLPGPAVVRAVVVGAVLALVYLALVRLAFPAILADSLSVLPAKRLTSRLAERLRLPAPQGLATPPSTPAETTTHAEEPR